MFVDEVGYEGIEFFVGCERGLQRSVGRGAVHVDHHKTGGVVRRNDGRRHVVQLFTKYLRRHVHDAPIGGHRLHETGVGL